MTFREVEKLIKKDGWYLTDTRGSHYYYKHPTKPGKLTLPHHSGDYKQKTLQSILEQAGL